MTLASGTQRADPSGEETLRSTPSQILIGVHGVGSPPLGVVARDISQGYANAHPNDEINMDSSNLSIAVGADTHLYQGIRLTNATDRIQIWEVNWSDLKGLPAGAIGSAFYAVKTLIAMIQIGDKGWASPSHDVTGPLVTGHVLRTYFCLITLVAPLNLLMIAYAYMQSNKMVAVAIILASTALLSLIIFWLSTVDRLIGFSICFLLLGAVIALWILIFPSSADFLLRSSIQAMGTLEAVLGLLVLACLLELLKIFVLVRKRGPKNEANLTVFVSRGGMIILAISLAAGAYGALVNAIGFYMLQRFFHWHLADPSAFARFEHAYMRCIGYDLAQVELVNGTTTFAVGLFLIAGMSYQLLRVSTSPDTCSKPRGRRVQDLVNVFLWLTFAGFFLVFIFTTLDSIHFYRASPCASDSARPDYQINWLPISSTSTANLTPLEIYAKSAFRIVPFLLPALIPPLRAVLNVAADVLLYILPPVFPLSLQSKSRERFRALLTYLRARHPNTPISVIAHSQGTVITSDVLGEDNWRITRLVTVGSPLSSLYRRFLGHCLGVLPRCEWINIYRLSDYIAGPISNLSIKDRILPTQYRAAHFRYFENGEVIKTTLGDTE
jgi:hypothetical protein